ncbi:hypothetical protein P5491_028695 (plasmid) [Priestia megaterium]
MLQYRSKLDRPDSLFASYLQEALGEQFIKIL